MELLGVNSVDLFNPGHENGFIMDLVLITLEFGVRIHVGIEVVTNLCLWM